MSFCLHSGDDDEEAGKRSDLGSVKHVKSPSSRRMARSRRCYQCPCLPGVVRWLAGVSNKSPLLEKKKKKKRGEDLS